MKSRSMFCLSFAVACATVSLHSLSAAERVATPPQPTKQLILPGEVFTVAGRTAFVFTPATVSGQQPAAKPWIL